MPDCVELQIALHRVHVGEYAVELLCEQPGSDSLIEVGRDREVRARFAFDELRALLLQPEAYGALLSRSLFDDRDIHSQFNRARAVAEATGAPLRLRLLIGRNAPELHDLHWETLCDPDKPECLLG